MVVHIALRAAKMIQRIKIGQNIELGIAFAVYMRSSMAPKGGSSPFWADAARTTSQKLCCGLLFR